MSSNQLTVTLRECIYMFMKGAGEEYTGRAIFPEATPKKKTFSVKQQTFIGLTVMKQVEGYSSPLCLGVTR